jgi:hypothetical protein
VGILGASSIPYIESILGERFTYTQAMGGLMTGVFIISAIVIFFGPEAHRISFTKSGSAPGDEAKRAEPASGPWPVKQPLAGAKGA